GGEGGVCDEGEAAGPPVAEDEIGAVAFDEGNGPEVVVELFLADDGLCAGVGVGRVETVGAAGGVAIEVDVGGVLGEVTGDAAVVRGLDGEEGYRAQDRKPQRPDAGRPLRAVEIDQQRGAYGD